MQKLTQHTCAVYNAIDLPHGAAAVQVCDATAVACCYRSRAPKN